MDAIKMRGNYIIAACIILLAVFIFAGCSDGAAKGQENNAAEVVTDVSLRPAQCLLDVGAQKKLIAAIVPATVKDKSISWSSNDKAIATVNDAGIVTGVAPGNTIIVAMAGTTKGICSVTITSPAPKDEAIAVKSVSLIPKMLNLAHPASHMLAVTVLPANASNKAVIFESSNPGVALVNAQGIVSTTGSGKATITVTTVDGKHTATSDVTVSAPAPSEPTEKIPVTSITLDLSEFEMFVSETQQINVIILPLNATDKTVDWSSSMPMFAQVSKTGIVNALVPGNTTIVATTHDGNYTARCRIIVKGIPVTSVSISPQDVTITKGESVQFLATVLPSNATYKTVIWEAVDSTLVSITQTGLVTANATKSGETQIKAMSVDGGLIDTTTINVN